MNARQAQFALWGGIAEVWCDDGERLDEALEAVHVVVAAVDQACSTYRPDSDISRVNAAAGETVPVGATLRQALRAALRCAAATDGLCDPTVGGATAVRPDEPVVLDSASGARTLDFASGARMLDFASGARMLDFASGARMLDSASGARMLDSASGARMLDSASGARMLIFAPGPRRTGDWRDVVIDDERGTVRIPFGVALDLNATGKAWAADLAAEQAARAARCAVLVNLCGDLAVGGPPTEQPWLVLVGDDHRSGQQDEGPQVPGGRVMVRDGGLATSSTTVRRRPVAGGSDTVSHVVDPRTWLPLQGQWRTASVAAASCLDANAAATAALVLADRAPQWLRRVGLPARLVAQDGTVELIGGWPR